MARTRDEMMQHSAFVYAAFERVLRLFSSTSAHSMSMLHRLTLFMLIGLRFLFEFYVN